jgi:threonine dehydrogenase-like Zn-dependent dehydrogenase
MVSAGICGSDIHLLQWNLTATMGHEVAGTLDDGTPVAIEPIISCGACAACISGNYNLCQLGASMVLGIGRDGAMADECLVPPSAIVPIPTGVAARDACLVEPLAVAVHGVRRGRVAPTDRVAVVGGGTLGQMASVAAQASGAGVDLEARHDRQREVAAQLGAGTVSDQYDVVIEAAGSESALARCAELCRPGGRIVLMGSYWETVALPGLQICMSEIDLIPASMYSREGSVRDIETAAAILGGRPDVPGHVITHRFPLDAVGEAFAVAGDRAAGAIKVVLEP